MSHWQAVCALVPDVISHLSQEHPLAAMGSDVKIMASKLDCLGLNPASTYHMTLDRFPNFSLLYILCL